jgi:hypothetical protein
MKDSTVNVKSQELAAVMNTKTSWYRYKEAEITLESVLQRPHLQKKFHSVPTDGSTA